MTPEQLSRFPRLAELKGLLNNFVSAVDCDPQLKATQQLLALLPDIDQTVSQELEVLASCQQNLHNSHARLMSLRDQVNEEYNNILDFVSSETWYQQHLSIVQHQREKWFCGQGQLQDLLLVWSKINEPWKYPVAMINAQHEEIIKVLISCYLLYMIDVDRDLLLKQYNNVENSVQPRGKFHTLPDWNWNKLDLAPVMGYNEHQMNWGVPSGQMALVVVWNLFERFNLWAAENFLMQAKQLLRPGGQIMFNTFDADSPSAAAFISDRKVGGMNKQQLTALVKKLDLEISMWAPHGSDFVSVVLTSPGTLHSDKTKWPTGIVKKS